MPPECLPTDPGLQFDKGNLKRNNFHRSLRMVFSELCFFILVLRKGTRAWTSECTAQLPEWGHAKLSCSSQFVPDVSINIGGIYFHKPKPVLAYSYIQLMYNYYYNDILNPTILLDSEPCACLLFRGNCGPSALSCILLRGLFACRNQVVSRVLLFAAPCLGQRLRALPAILVNCLLHS